MMAPAHTRRGAPRPLVAGYARLVRIGVIVLLTVAAGALPLRGQQAPIEDPALAEARAAFEATEYERALDLLDALIVDRSGREGDPEQRRIIVAAYELRGRARVNLTDEERARADFRFLLTLEPSHTLPFAAGRSEEIFAEVRAETVGTAEIRVTPDDATVTLDGGPLGSTASIPLTAGRVYTLRATRVGYRDAARTFLVEAGQSQEIALALERVSSTITIVTSPPEVEVLVDGVLRGVTVADSVADATAAPGTPPVSRPFELLDIPTGGQRRLEFRRACYLSTETLVAIPRADDYRLDAVRLQPAVASVRVEADVPDATVFVDGVARGAAPLTEEICHGPRTIEVRTRWGRDLRRMDLRAGQSVTFEGRVRPAFAIVSDSGATEGVRGARDLREATEDEFRDARSLLLFASPAERTATLFTDERLPSDWLAFDMLHQPLGGAATIGEPARRRFGDQFAQAFDAQGIAAIAREPDGDRADMLLILLAPGSAEPDVLRWRMDDPASVRETIARLDASPPALRPSLGMLPIDVLDVEGAVVAMVEADGNAAGAGIRAGEVIARAAGMPVQNAAHLLTLVAQHPAGQALPLDVRDAAGTVRTVELPLRQVPHVVALMDRTLLFNKLAVELTARASGALTPLEEVAVRLNLSVAHLRLEQWNEALRQLELVEGLMEKNPGLAGWATEAVRGTVLYFRGVAAEGNGDDAAAERAWTEAAASPASLLTDTAEPLADAASRRLAQLRQSRGGGR